ncbi:hypothetical protein L1987_43450 [Smallanthus sonchifolius]|uniref:Uncharacterized protein n=1 Tax=Smallanthus sonchifolius TaxID=185202 RepID=A0ACB9GLS4_9ASTR|nr:hypothetical protein L1987_43450 [Smallanthus sonchifolius]
MGRSKNCLVSSRLRFISSSSKPWFMIRRKPNSKHALPNSFTAFFLSSSLECLIMEARSTTGIAIGIPKKLIFSLWFIEKNDTGQSFIKGDSHDKFQVMLSMYEVEKELSVYVTTNNNFEISLMQQRGTGDVHDEESEYSLSDESYHSHYNKDQEVEEENSAMNHILALEARNVLIRWQHKDGLQVWLEIN